MKNFYKNVVKGPAPAQGPARTWREMYYNRYMARGNESAAPLFHYLLLIIPAGYIIKVCTNDYILISINKIIIRAVMLDIFILLLSSIEEIHFVIINRVEIFCQRLNFFDNW